MRNIFRLRPVKCNSQSNMIKSINQSTNQGNLYITNLVQVWAPYHTFQHALDHQHLSAYRTSYLTYFPSWVNVDWGWSVKNSKQTQQEIYSQLKSEMKVRDDTKRAYRLSNQHPGRGSPNGINCTHGPTGHSSYYYRTCLHYTQSSRSHHKQVTSTGKTGHLPTTYVQYIKYSESQIATGNHGTHTIIIIIHNWVWLKWLYWALYQAVAEGWPLTPWGVELWWGCWSRIISAVWQVTMQVDLHLTMVFWPLQVNKQHPGKQTIPR